MKKNLKAFTFIELLVVIFILAGIAAILLPALKKAKETADARKITLQSAGVVINFSKNSCTIENTNEYQVRIKAVLVNAIRKSEQTIWIKFIEPKSKIEEKISIYETHGFYVYDNQNREVICFISVMMIGGLEERRKEEEKKKQEQQNQTQQTQTITEEEKQKIIEEVKAIADTLGDSSREGFRNGKWDNFDETVLFNAFHLEKEIPFEQIPIETLKEFLDEYNKVKEQNKIPEEKQN